MRLMRGEMVRHSMRRRSLYSVAKIECLEVTLAWKPVPTFTHPALWLSSALTPELRRQSLRAIRNLKSVSLIKEAKAHHSVKIEWIEP